ncbi:hypothetical protein OB2597_19331 [Pseudooceanicola batsensis HTCC2597]|uniref:BON domain-containing protein n=1 Tax=Pseudooceanicola batsensis (strain ATCC BAA-863 / DSM 15984 / KCTC 12145 / HTCC2597) TaxID=252305 RepID=A3U0H6_PSEBH|nr:BON domain-containing protein [Pseudooceanicola batsensis]EAQ02267.1 hypothetical protein OB2597_19331 [Pseudooceanicola batsensis HTCC2597]
MAPRFSRNPDHHPRARADWDPRDVVPPRDRFGGPPPGRRGRDPYESADDRDQWDDPVGDRMDLPQASPVTAGWPRPYDYPLRRPLHAGYSAPRDEGPDEYWRTRDYDRRPGIGYGDGGPRGGRGFFDKAADEVSSWVGDDDAERRREEDHRGRGPRNYTRSDARIEEDVNDRLTDDSAVDASEIEVTVKEREVTLDGHVDSRRAKRRAEDCADTISGIVHVQNNLRIRPAETARQPGTV